MRDLRTLVSRPGVADHRAPRPRPADVSYGGGMPLLLIDLDDTLIDRTGALLNWATGLTEALGRPPVDVRWIQAIDSYGTADRAEVAWLINTRFDLRGPVAQAVEEILREGFAADAAVFPGVKDALDTARTAGWKIVVVTNGPTEQQRLKMRHTGLNDHVDATVVSEAVGLAKPDPEIFALAADEVRSPLAGAWMVGDSPGGDIRGARNAGIKSVWLHRGRSWPIADLRPTVTADSPAEAIRIVLDR